VPAARLDGLREAGLGWAAAGLALTTFEQPAASPWGPMSEVRQVPVPATETRIAVWPDAPPFNLVLCRALDHEGAPWDCCPRHVLGSALADLERLTGLTLHAAMEHEFTLLDTGLEETVSFSLGQMRHVAGFIDDLARALDQAQVDAETIEPEAGRCQYEVACGPAPGLAAADRMVLTREVIREAARRRGYRASFSPKPFPDAIGSGAHLHFSLVDAAGRNMTCTDESAMRLSPLAGSFAAGVIRHLGAMAPFFAASPASYLRLAPGSWSCGYASFGVQNREAALRVCPPPAFVGPPGRKSFNLEFRPLDGASNPYLALAALVRAGIEGIRARLPAPRPVDCDPASLDEAGREALGITRLPRSLDEALSAMSSDPVVASWLSPDFRSVLLSVLAKEADLARALAPDDLCRRYRRVL
ncbi:MAG: glutamine synthetase, partial [Parvibaculaceae bacterium]